MIAWHVVQVLRNAFYSPNHSALYGLDHPAHRYAQQLTRRGLGCEELCRQWPTSAIV